MQTEPFLRNSFVNNLSERHYSISYFFLSIKMKIEEVVRIINHCPYHFAEDEISFDPSTKYKNHMTCAMYWICKWKTVPPQCLLHRPDIIGENIETCAMIWIKTCGSVPPHCLLHDPSIQNRYRETCAMLWIEKDAYTKYVPNIEEFLDHYDDRAEEDIWVEDEEEEETHSNESDSEEASFDGAEDEEEEDSTEASFDEEDAVPRCLIHNPSLQAMNGWTCAMHWITVKGTVPPRRLIHNPAIQDENGFTCAMHWIEYHDNPSNIPKCLIHNPTILNVYGRTCAMRCIEKWHSIPQKELLHDPSIQNAQGLTCAMIWIQEKPRTYVPQCLLHDASIRNCRGRTCAMMWILINKALLLNFFTTLLSEMMVDGHVQCIG